MLKWSPNKRKKTPSKQNNSNPHFNFITYSRTVLGLSNLLNRTAMVPSCDRAKLLTHQRQLTHPEVRAFRDEIL